MTVYTVAMAAHLHEPSEPRLLRRRRTPSVDRAVEVRPVHDAGVGQARGHDLAAEPEPPARPQAGLYQRFRNSDS